MQSRRATTVPSAHMSYAVDPHVNDHFHGLYGFPEPCFGETEHHELLNYILLLQYML